MDDKAKEAVERIRLKEQEENRRIIRKGIYVGGTALVTGITIWGAVERSNKNEYIGLLEQSEKNRAQQQLTDSLTIDSLSNELQEIAEAYSTSEQNLDNLKQKYSIVRNQLAYANSQEKNYLLTIDSLVKASNSFEQLYKSAKEERLELEKANNALLESGNSKNDSINILNSYIESLIGDFEDIEMKLIESQNWIKATATRWIGAFPRERHIDRNHIPENVYIQPPWNKDQLREINDLNDKFEQDKREKIQRNDKLYN